MIPEWLGKKKINVDFYEVMKKYYFSKTKRDLERQPPFFEEMRGLGIGQGLVDFYNSPDGSKARN